MIRLITFLSFSFFLSTLTAQTTVKFTQQTGSVFDNVTKGEIDFADVDGDNDPDVLISGETQNGTRIAKLYQNDGNGNFTLQSGTPFIGVALSSHDFADIDGDNDLDVIISGIDSSSVRRTDLYINNGVGVFTLSTTSSFIGVRSSCVVFADINSDGDQDVLISGRDASFNHITNVYSNNGLGTFSLLSSSSIDSVISAEVIFSDFDGDNDQDLLIYGHSFTQGDIAKLYLNTGTGLFLLQNGTPFVPVQSGGSGIHQNYLAAGDIDGDGDEDILSVGDSASGNAFTGLYRNTGNGNFALISSSSIANIKRRSSCEFSDVDMDGDLDIITSGRTTNSNLSRLIRISLNDGTGIFTPINVAAFSNWTTGNSSSQGDLSFADVDGDGDEDLLIQGYNAFSIPTTRLLLNTSCEQTDTVLNVTQCGAYTAPSGRVFSLSGNYKDTLPNTTGCDSVIMINLTIDTVNTSVNQSGIVLTANQANANYQWLDCNNGYAPLINETSQTFTANTNGLYAVELTRNSCVDTSQCISVVSVGLETQNLKFEEFLISPNPSRGLTTFKISEQKNIRGSIFIYDITGKLIYSFQLDSNTKEINLDSLSNGVYFVQYNQTVKKFILSK